MNALPAPSSGAISGFNDSNELESTAPVMESGLISMKSLGTARLTPSSSFVISLKPEGTSAAELLECEDELDRDDELLEPDFDDELWVADASFLLLSSRPTRRKATSNTTTTAATMPMIGPRPRPDLVGVA